MADADGPLIASLDDEFSGLEKNIDKMNFPVRKKNSTLLGNFKRVLSGNWQILISI